MEKIFKKKTPVFHKVLWAQTFSSINTLIFCGKVTRTTWGTIQFRCTILKCRCRLSPSTPTICESQTREHRDPIAPLNSISADTWEHTPTKLGNFHGFVTLTWRRGRRWEVTMITNRKAWSHYTSAPLIVRDHSQLTQGITNLSNYILTFNLAFGTLL